MTKQVNVRTKGVFYVVTTPNLDSYITVVSLESLQKTIDTLVVVQ